MSASLVGSEMCIRDSRSTRIPVLAPPRSDQASPRSPCTRGPRALTCPRAVSYTHLTLPTICSV
eukprot:7627538-Alexandrium_andersonii.AAC.1